MKTLWKKEKMLATSIFSFSHNVFYPATKKLSLELLSFCHLQVLLPSTKCVLVPRVKKFQNSNSSSHFALVLQLDKEEQSTCPDQCFPSKDERTSGFFGPWYQILLSCKYWSRQPEFLQVLNKTTSPNTSETMIQAFYFHSLPHNPEI